MSSTTVTADSDSKKNESIILTVLARPVEICSISYILCHVCKFFAAPHHVGDVASDVIELDFFFVVFAFFRILLNAEYIAKAFFAAIEFRKVTMHPGT